MKKQISQGKVVEVTVNNKEENSSSDFCLDLAIVSFNKRIHTKKQSFNKKKFILYFIAPSLGCQRVKILQAFLQS